MEMRKDSGRRRQAKTTPAGVLARYDRAKARRAPWETQWRDAYEYALPIRDSGLSAGTGAPRADRVFDATAADAVEQLAASLMGQLTPPWSAWFGLSGGDALEPAERSAAAEPLDRAARALQAHFDMSNFAVEMHQCYLDLVTAGTACLSFEEAPFGETSAFRFTAVPLAEVAFEEGPDGRLDTVYRRKEYTESQLRSRFPGLRLPAGTRRSGDTADEPRHAVVEAVMPATGGGFDYMAVLAPGPDGVDAPRQLTDGRFSRSPFIAFRWLKAPGEIYGRSPVMKALPDIKTANKVVELVLKNASIAVTGIWQADDDGVLNPAAIRLVPGTIIPKAVGSRGLTPLEAPGRFDVSQLVLEDLRARIRHALLADRLAQVDGPRMTATEVLERSAEMARILGATYGRLQAELLNPLVERGMAILRRRGEVPDIVVDGRVVALQYRSPLARSQRHQEVQGATMWFEMVRALGPQALAVVDAERAARWLARALNLPEDLIREEGESPAMPLAMEAGHV